MAFFSRKKIGALVSEVSLRERRFRWFLVNVLVAMLIAVGMAAYLAVDDAMERSVKETLNSERRSVAKGLNVWLDGQRSFATSIASTKNLAVAAKAFKSITVPAELKKHPSQSDVKAFLEPMIKARGYTRYRLVGVSPDPKSQIVLSSNTESIIGTPSKLLDAKDAERLRNGEAIVTLPRVDDDNPANTCVFVIAPLCTAGNRPILDDEGTLLAAIGFRVSTEEIVSVLKTAVFLQHGEGILFDRWGRLLTPSRYDAATLRSYDLVRDSEQSYGLELRDPGVDLTRGRRPSLPREDQPFIRPVAGVNERKMDGVNYGGYRDCCGRWVVGAWEWLDSYDCGLAIQLDYKDAYEPLRPLFWAGCALFALLAIAFGIAMLYAFRAASLQRAILKAEQTARKLGQYTLEKRLGGGGMGEVFLGRHSMLRRPVAVKLLKPEITSERALKRFEREVQLTSTLQHPNTIVVYDFGRTDAGTFYYVMEFLDGIDLEDLVREEGPLPEARVIHLLLQICGSLAEAHSRGLVHRDIKPANAMACRRGGVYDFVKVLDFGLAKDAGSGDDQKLTRLNALTGTPHYVAPESISKPNAVDPARDLYALGAVGYFLLTGLPVFEADSLYDLCKMHLETPPVPPSQRTRRAIQSDLESVIMRCLAKEPLQRPASAEVIAKLLRGCANSGVWTIEDAKNAWRNRPTNPLAADSPTASENEQLATAVANSVTMEYAIDESVVNAKTA